MQAAAAGLVLGPLAGARSIHAAAPTSAAETLGGAAVPAGFSIVDAHIHLWDLTEFPVPWIASNKVLNRSYVLQDFKDQSAGLGIGSIVYVQAAVANEYALLEADYQQALRIWNKNLIVAPEAIQVTLDSIQDPKAQAAKPPDFFDNSLIEAVNKDYGSKLFPDDIK